MKQLARAYIWWPGLDKNIEDQVKQCSVCQETQSSPPKSPLLPIRWPSRPWSRVHVDLAGPFMGHTFLVLIDGFSKWIEVYIVHSASSPATITCLRKIFSSFGVPEVLVSDNGRILRVRSSKFF